MVDAPVAPMSRGSKLMVWIGRVIGALPLAALFMSAWMKLSKAEVAVKGWEQAGLPAGTLVPIGVVELVCAILYLIPQTAVLGAILLTGYLGGAVVTHVRASEDFSAPIIIGVMLWVGLYLRDSRVRSLAPWRFLPAKG